MLDLEANTKYVSASDFSTAYFESDIFVALNDCDNVRRIEITCDVNKSKTIESIIWINNSSIVSIEGTIYVGELNEIDSYEIKEVRIILGADIDKV